MNEMLVRLKGGVNPWASLSRLIVYVWALALMIGLPNLAWYLGAGLLCGFLEAFFSYQEKRREPGYVWEPTKKMFLVAGGALSVTTLICIPLSFYELTKGPAASSASFVGSLVITYPLLLSRLPKQSSIGI